MELPLNMSIDADPHQQAAALPLMLVVLSFLRTSSFPRDGLNNAFQTGVAARDFSNAEISLSAS